MFLLGVVFQAEDGIRDLVRSRGLGDVYKRQELLRLLESRFKLRLQKATGQLGQTHLIKAQRRDLSLIHI